MNVESKAFKIGFPNYDQIVKMVGDSMSPEIEDGEYITLQPIEDFSFLLAGYVYLIVTNNGLRTVRRLGESQCAAHYRLIPSNEAYDEQDIPQTEIRQVYLVNGVIKVTRP